MSSFDELQKLDPQAAAMLDFDFFLMCPPPMAADASEEEQQAFFAQLDTATAVCDEKAEKILKEKHNS